jgi:hypothetical protein
MSEIGISLSLSPTKSKKKHSSGRDHQLTGNYGRTTRVKRPGHQNDMLDFDGERRLVLIAGGDP